MPRQKNSGPCAVQNCNNKTDRFRQITSLAYNKAQEKKTCEIYNYLRPGQQLCHIHYMSIVEPDRNQKSKTPLSIETDKENMTIENMAIDTESKNYSFAEQVTMLTKVLYEQRDNAIELDPIRFQQMIERANP